ncbi:MAG: anti-sigma F factor [Clostridia bacterium]|nr:anti-sigma F factor [Clostridia bacterium]
MKSKCVNKLQIVLPALSVNESAARTIVSAFCAQLNPTIEEIADIKCAVSEAVTNSIVHAYREKQGDIYIAVRIFDNRTVKIEIKDKGCGIEDTELVKTPLYTTDQSGERSGMGFAVMESFMDKLVLKSIPGKYTKVILSKKLSPLEL